MKKDTLVFMKDLGLSCAELESNLALGKVYNKLGEIVDKIVGKDSFLVEVINSNEAKGATLSFDLSSNMGAVGCSVGTRKFKNEKRSVTTVFMKSTLPNVGWTGIYKIDIYTEEHALKRVQERSSYEEDDMRLKNSIYIVINNGKRILVEDTSGFSEANPSMILNFLNGPDLKIIHPDESDKLASRKQTVAYKLIKS